MPNNKLTTVDIHPAETAEKCVIWLHGLGADGNDFAPIVPKLHIPAHLKIKFVFPHAPIMPVTINNGYEMRAWFDISHPNISASIDHAGINKSVQAVNTLIQHEQEQGIDAAHIMLAGFSQGAVIALITGMLHPERLAGIIALSGLLPHAADVIQQAPAVSRGIPVFIGHGTQDQLVPAAFGEFAYHEIAKAGYPVEWHSYPMAHSVCTEEIQDISHWIQKIWK